VDAVRTRAGHLGWTSPRRPVGPAGPVDPAAAEAVLCLHHAENPDAGPVQPRLDAVLAQLDRHGTYAHTAAELACGRAR
jgi:nitric-oxide synthase, bacterial